MAFISKTDEKLKKVISGINGSVFYFHTGVNVQDGSTKKRFGSNMQT